MNEDKQIEEMSKIASKCITSWLNNETPKVLPDYIAEALYTASYRKASDVAREIFEEIEDIRLEHSYGEIDGNELNVKLFNLKKKYESEGEG